MFRAKHSQKGNAWAAVNSQHSALSIQNPQHRQKRIPKHTTVGIRCWSPTQLLLNRYTASVPQSGRDALISVFNGRM